MLVPCFHICLHPSLSNFYVSAFQEKVDPKIHFERKKCLVLFLSITLQDIKKKKTQFDLPFNTVKDDELFTSLQ